MDDKLLNTINQMGQKFINLEATKNITDFEVQQQLLLDNLKLCSKLREIVNTDLLAQDPDAAMKCMLLMSLFRRNNRKIRHGIYSIQFDYFKLREKTEHTIHKLQGLLQQSQLLQQDTDLYNSIQFDFNSLDLTPIDHLASGNGFATTKNADTTVAIQESKLKFDTSNIISDQQLDSYSRVESTDQQLDHQRILNRLHYEFEQRDNFKTSLNSKTEQIESIKQQNNQLKADILLIEPTLDKLTQNSKSLYNLFNKHFGSLAFLKNDLLKNLSRPLFCLCSRVYQYQSASSIKLGENKESKSTNLELSMKLITDVNQLSDEMVANLKVKVKNRLNSNDQLQDFDPARLTNINVDGLDTQQLDHVLFPFVNLDIVHKLQLAPNNIVTCTLSLCFFQIKNDDCILSSQIFSVDDTNIARCSYFMKNRTNILDFLVYPQESLACEYGEIIDTTVSDVSTYTNISTTDQILNQVNCDSSNTDAILKLIDEKSYFKKLLKDSWIYYMCYSNDVSTALMCNDQNLIKTIEFDQLISLIEQRINSQVYLSSQLYELESGKLPSLFRNVFNQSNINTCLNAASNSVDNNYHSSSWLLPSTGSTFANFTQANDSDSPLYMDVYTFNIASHLVSTNISLQCSLSIPINYPNAPSLVKISAINDSTLSTGQSIKNIEQLANIKIHFQPKPTAVHFDNQYNDSLWNSLLISRQIYYIQYCFDQLQHLSTSSNNLQQEYSSKTRTPLFQLPSF